MSNKGVYQCKLHAPFLLSTLPIPGQWIWHTRTLLPLASRCRCTRPAPIKKATYLESRQKKYSPQSQPRFLHMFSWPRSGCVRANTYTCRHSAVRALARRPYLETRSWTQDRALGSAGCLLEKSGVWVLGMGGYVSVEWKSEDLDRGGVCG